MEEGSIEVKQEHNAQKLPIRDGAIILLLDSVRTVFVASGKKILEYQLDSENREEVVTQITGRTGNLRAPTLKKGQVLFVGFNTELFAQLTNS